MKDMLRGVGRKKSGKVLGDLYAGGTLAVLLSALSTFFLLLSTGRPLPALPYLLLGVGLLALLAAQGKFGHHRRGF
jgi:hypothetical protein